MTYQTPPTINDNATNTTETVTDTITTVVSAMMSLGIQEHITSQERGQVFVIQG